jgi:hypothetical protein
MALTPSQMQTIIENNDAINDAAKAIQSAETQSAQNAAVQILTGLCQARISLLFVLELEGEASDPFTAALLVSSWQTQQAAAQAAVNGCTDLSQNTVALWQTVGAAYGSAVQSFLSNSNLNTNQSADFTALDKDAGVGNLSAAVAATHQFVSDSPQTGITYNSDGGYTYQHNGITEIFAANTLPEEVTWQNLDGSTTTSIYPDILNTNNTTVFDPINNTINSTPGSDDNSLVITEQNPNSSVVIGRNTFDGTNYTTGGKVSVFLVDQFGDAIGTLTIDPQTGERILTTAGGQVVDYSGAGQLSFTQSADGGIDIADTGTARGTLYAHITPIDGVLENAFGIGSLLNSFWDSKFSYQQTPGSPIILDLTGQGVQTISEDAGTYFDLRNTGFAEKTGWVAPQDGLLVFDPSGGPVTDGNQLFGNYTTMPNGMVAPNGFAALAALAAPGATSLNAATSLIDPATGVSYFSELMVWQDANSNGIVDPAELQSLSSLGIQSLNLTYTNQSTNLLDGAGNNPQYVGTYTTTSGATMAMDDVNFANNTSQTVAENWVATTPAIDALPDLPGMGTLYSLHQAMAMDTTGNLQNLVTQFTTETDVASRDATLEQILIYWAGAENINPTSDDGNGGNFDAQHLAVLEAAEGRTYGAGFSLPNPTDPYPEGVPQLNEAYTLFFERMYSELAAQTFLQPFYNEITTTTDSSGNVQYDFTAVLADLFGNSRPAAVQQTDIEEFYRTIFASGLLDSQVNYAGLLSSLAANAPQYVAAVNQIVAPYYGYNLMPSGGAPGYDDLNPSGDNATIVAGLGGATIDANEGPGNSTVYNITVYGNAGTNTINVGPDGVDKIYGGTGNDTINDTGTLAAGTIIDGGTGNNTLSLYTGVGADISLATISNIQTVVVNTSGTTMTAAQFSEFTNIIGPGEIDAATAGTYDLTLHNVSSGTVNLNARYATGNVTLIGNDQNGQILTGGSGVGTITGGNGANDIFYGGTGTTSIVAGNGVGDILDAGNPATVLYAGSGGDRLNADSSSTVASQIYGGAGNDTISDTGTLAAGTIIDGGAGNNTLSLYTGGSADISQATISNIQTVVLNTSGTRMTAAQFNSFTNIIGPGEIDAITAGTYDLTLHTVTGSVNLNARYSTGNVSLIGNDQNFQVLTGGPGVGTITGGNGTGDVLNGGIGTTSISAGTGTGDTLNAANANTILYAGSGGDKLNAYSSSTVASQIFGGVGNDTITDYGTLAAGTIIDGGAGSNTLNLNLGVGADISRASVSNIQTVMLNSDGTTMTAAQHNSFANITGTGIDTILGGSGANTYQFGAVFGQDVVKNANGGNSTALGEIDFTAASVTDENLWFTRNGNDLVIVLLGTSNTITVSGWFGGNAGAQVQDFNAASGFNLTNTAVAQLVNAMATYQAAHPTFNAATATQMPSDSALQSAIAAAWIDTADTTGVSVAVAETDRSMLDTTVGGYKVVDTAANVTAGLTFLTSDAGHISSIVLTDSTTPTLALTAAQYSADSAALAKISSPYNLSISGVMAANASTVAGQAHVTSITVSDTTANVVANLSPLQTLAAAGTLGSIMLTDSSTPTLALTAAQLTGDSPVLAKITSAYNLSISGGGTATMGSGISGVQTVALQSASSPYDFTASNLTGLAITDSSATNDTLTAGTGGDTLIGGTGADTFVLSVTGNDTVMGGTGDANTAVFSGDRSIYSISGAGNGVTVTDTATGAIDTLTSVQTLQFADGTAIYVTGNVLTQQNVDGSEVVSTYNITGEPYTSSVLTYNAGSQLVSALYSGVTGEGNLSSYEYLYTSVALIGTDEFYTGITGQPYATEEIDYNGVGLLTRAAFSGVSGEPYSAYEYDYVGGVFAGAQYTFTNVPAGAAYSSYVVDQNPSNTFAGEQFYFTNMPGQPYTGEEEDFDANVSLTRVVLTGVQNQAYSSLELDYAGMTYTGYKTYYTGLTGPYSSEEVDVSAANQIEKVVYSGLTATPYSSVEQDYAGGSLVDEIYSFTNVTGQPYYAYQVDDNAGGAALQETLDLASGGHDLIALASGQTLTSLGLDTMTGSASGATTFVLNAIYGQDTIANPTAADTVSLPTAEFASFNALLGAAQNQGANVVITAGDGDTLTLNNMTKTQLTGMAANFTFHV